jgi:hypothetical protein
MNEWAEGKFKMLVETTLRHMKASLTQTRGSTTAKQRAKVFHGKMLQGDIQGEGRYLTNRKTGWVLYPHKTDEKSKKSMLQVLKSKHSDAKIPEPETLHRYTALPE